jgi:ubiquinone/menaquinone biosynthesis C-methylase UbiE
VTRIHNMLCSSRWWARRAEHELVPWGLKGVELGDDVLEIGPGFGATTRVLARSVGHLSVLELDEGYCRRLRAELGNGSGGVNVVQGDATGLPFPDGRFSAVLCFTMLHHIPTIAQQDQAFGEVARVLRSGGTFAGTDSVGRGWLFHAIHVGDTLNLIDPDSLPARLEAAGLNVRAVQRGGQSFRWRATKP